ncbi:MAG: hypothetical protein QOI10_4566 [Solirubrobacterales bacterium]|nr:hypothetical protein [Solirubrobacterales bacterium]
MNSETPHILPGGETVYVIDTKLASEHLATMLGRFRSGNSEPLIFGDAGQPEAVVIPWAEWQQLMALAEDEEGFNHLYDQTRERLANRGDEPSVPIEDVAAELGWDLKGDDDSEHPKP